MSAPTSTSNPRPYASKRRNPMVQRRQQAITVASATVAGQLEEANQWGIARLMEIFGVEFVMRIAAGARERYDAAQALGQTVNESQPHGTDVVTRAGTPRTPGGVFFYLMREHANSLNLDWYGLHIPPPPPDPASSTNLQPHPSQPAPDASTEAARQEPQGSPKTPHVPENNAPAVKKEAVQSDPVDKPAAAKPNRIKATIIGSPRGEPQKTDQPGVLQLLFDVEMSTSMPKGLPTLGRSRVIVLCTEKQYRQVQPGGITPYRMIVDGEVATTLSTDGKPLLLVVCTRMTTPEIEQTKRINQDRGC